MHIQDGSVQEKIRVLIGELENALAGVEQQEKLKVISKIEAASIRKSIQQSIDDLIRIPCN